MFIKEAHIMIEQGLQKIGVFAHYDVSPEEVDLSINSWIVKTVEEEFAKEKKEGLTKPQLDKYAILIEKEISFNVLSNERGYEFTLPDNYFHLIKGDAIVTFECGSSSITNIEVGERYYVAKGSVSYNSHTYIKGTTFIGVTGFVSFTGANTKVIKYKKILSSLRFLEEEFSTLANANSLSKTKPKSPIATLAGTKIYINVDKFYIEKAYLSYVRKPDKVNINYVTYDSTKTLSVGTEYQVMNGSVVYESVTYSAPASGFEYPSFKITSSANHFTGNGIVRVKNDGDIKLPIDVAQKIVDRVILNMSIVSEDNPQKTQGLASINQIT